MFGVCIGGVQMWYYYGYGMLVVFQLCGQMCGVVDDLFVIVLWVQVCDDGFVCVLDVFDVVCVVVGLYIVVYVIGGVVQGKFMQCDEVVFVEEIVCCVLCLFGYVDFVFG